MDTPISPAFTSLAYALILLRQDGYPCVFYGDIYGISTPHPAPPTCGGKLADLILARKLYAYGEQDDYFFSPNCVGWVRKGTMKNDGQKAAGMAIVMSWVSNDHKQYSLERPGWVRRRSGKLGLGQATGHQFQRKMNVGREHSGEVWTDILGNSKHKVTITHDGSAPFPCPRNCVAVYVSERAAGRDRFPVHFQSDIHSN